MKTEDIESVMALMERHGIAAFDYEDGSIQVHLTLGSPAGDAVMAAPVADGKAEPDTILSPAVGIVLHAHPLRADTPPALPRDVTKGAVVAYIRTGLTLRAVIAGTDCRLQRTITPEGVGVGYGDALFEIAL